jgi:hypothetical protein
LKPLEGLGRYYLNTLDFWSVFAYIDPGTGSIVIQSVIGVIAGVAVFGRRVIAGLAQKVKALFSRTEPDNSIDKP